VRRRDLDGVIVSAPDDLHAPITRAALDAGCTCAARSRSPAPPPTRVPCATPRPRTAGSG
jgi:hypothetical protein